ncbi:DUF4347 domain-containing protein [Leptolyngbya ohadii]|uniref:DUF4347 domain-containing protein n=1 Tax=Leptolyngbya ohadii TaxID=1962290 RepID=UPI000B59CDD5|nr:DUF4347 domain-containing protein [Leptolyngbya ohadii]
MTSATSSKTLLIVDPSVQDYSSLTDHLTVEADVVVLDADQDGVEQITAALRERQAVQSLHLLSHGSPGTLYLGNTELSLATLPQYADQIQNWISALTDRAEVLLYGCEVAAGNLGQLFIQTLSHLTGASIAASTNRTGSAALGGDWTLESTVGAILSSPIFSPTAMAEFQSVLAPVDLVRETFTRSEVNPGTAFWTSGIGAEVLDTPGNPATAPFLTARPVTTANPTQTPAGVGGIPGNPVDLGGTPDPDGLGVLRLTNNSFNQAGFVLYNQPILAQAGLSITFDMFQYNGGTGNAETDPEGGDGISFFLIDGSTPFSDQAGAFGGSLGYAQKTDIPGVAGGYLGIGFDAFGNYPIGSEGRSGGLPLSRSPNTVAVRGAGTGAGPDQYPFLVADPIEEFPLYVDTTVREAALRTVQITLSRDGILNVSIDSNNDDDFADPGEAVITNFDTITATEGIVPPTFKFGFAAGTGVSTAIHEIRNLVVTTLTSPPLTNSASVGLPINSRVNIPGLGGTDTDGSITAFQILTLPSPAQGQLFLGDPALGGVPVTQGQTLTPAQINQVFFQSTGLFTGSSFTYTALDNLGSPSVTPGVVSLQLQSGPPIPPNGGLPPDTLGRDFNVPQNTLTNLPGLGGVDPNEGGAITSFTILTVPNSTQGTLFLGLPSAGGRPVRPGQVIPADEIGQLFFRSSNNFNSTSFTYAATNNNGLTDPTPANVGIRFSRFIEDLNCAEGITLRGNRRNNRLVGTQDEDRLIGNRGNDRLIGKGCADNLDGSRGNDRLVGGTASDTLRGQQNRDEMRGNNGNDTIDGGLGNDRGFGGRGRDTMRGGRGNDRLEGRQGDDNILGGRGSDRIMGGANIDILEGQQNDDRIMGQNGIDFINTGLGNDRADGGRKADTIFGRRGNDRLLGKGAADRLFGNKGDDRLLGASQADRLLGGLGNDRIFGGLGADVMSGGGGRDTYVYTSTRQGFDRILDFTRQDRMDLQGIFNGSYSGNNRFRQYVRLSDTARGTVVRVDGNGNAAGGFVRLAVLEGVSAADLGASNFLVG